MRGCSDTNKPPEGGFFVDGERITSFRQREQQVQQRAQRLRQQQERVQMRQQPVQVQQREPVREQERGFLFCHKRPKRRPT
jgi:hypothetical protein